MSYETIRFDIDEGVARLTLNRPEKLNSFNVQMHGEVRHAFGELSSLGARALVITEPAAAFVRVKTWRIALKV
jgi:2-(1,2-epoxy-1,2-dihydrophenyl)acetyl-CoA isomerase